MRRLDCLSDMKIVLIALGVILAVNACVNMATVLHYRRERSCNDGLSQ